MQVWFKHGLVRVIAFLIVGIAVVVSTQLLRGHNPEDVSSNIKQLARSTILAWLQEPVRQDQSASVLQDIDGNQINHTAAEATVALPPPPKTLTFATAQTTVPKVDVPSFCENSEVAAGSIVMGDKIHLRFFAAVQINSADVGSSSETQTDSVAYERLDLSGTYDIGEDGTAALPLIGRMELVGRTLACSEALVAREMASLDSSISTVTASFAARLPVTVSGAVRAPGAYTHAPGMTVNRLLNLAGASFGEGPITPQEFESLTAQRDEMLHRQILVAIELGHLKANIDGNDSIVIADDLAANVPRALLSALIDGETKALRQELSVSKISDERSAVAVAGLEQKLADTRMQIDAVKMQISSLQVRLDEMTAFKDRGLIQGSQLDAPLSHLMELTRIGLQLETDQTNLRSQIDLAKQDARLAVQIRLQDYSRRAAALSGEISLYEVQLAAIDAQLAGHGIGTDGSDFALPLVISLLRTDVSGAYRLDASLDTAVLPGDMVTISLSANATEKQVTAENDVEGDAGGTASGSLQP